MSNKPPSPSGIRDNHARGTVADFLKQELKPGADLDFVTAYFTVFAYHKLRHHLDSLGQTRMLFGEAAFVKKLDPANTDGAAYVLNHEGLELGNGLAQRHIARACAKWIQDKVEVRSVTQSGFLHGKMSCVRHEGGESAILGSSNFTTPGLGLATSHNNVELNLEVTDKRDLTDLQRWFEELWNDPDRVENVKEAVLAYLRQVASDQSPEFIYYKTLYELFKDFIEAGEELDDNLHQVRLLDTAIWKILFYFQREGVKSAISKIKSFNGCILADSVGLGKTYTALAVIKYFELRNDKVLVLCPKKLSRNWIIYRQPSTLNPFQEDRFRFDVLHHTDLSRYSGQSNGLDLGSLNWGAYDLIVIDESHNFRNNRHAADGAESHDGEHPKQTRYQRLMEDIIQTGARTKVLMLSATPVNNQLADLRNQISLMAGGDVVRDPEADRAFSEKLGIESIRETTRQAQAQFTFWADPQQSAKKRSTRDLITKIGGGFFRLLDGVSLARSRHQIKTHFADEMAKIGGFPDRKPPESVHADIDLDEKFPTFEKVDKMFGESSGEATGSDKIRLILYHPTQFLRDDLTKETRETYQREILGGFTQEGRERILIAMMKINLLKRLESSVCSFRATIERTIDKIDELEKRIERFQAHQKENPDIDYNEITPDEFDDPDFADADFVIGKHQQIHLAHLKLPEWLKAVREDRARLQSLLEEAVAVTPERDGKLAKLKELISDKVNHPTRNRDGKENRKILVFTAYADTARYLYDNLESWAQTELGRHLGLVCGSGGNKRTLGKVDYDHILTNFSPISKRRSVQSAAFSEQQKEIDLLIATDCISEGQDLQDCDLLVNYDIHWNPVRIIQRFGRIDRIGSRNSAIRLVNFWPTPDLDVYLGVKHRVEARMALADMVATQTDNPLDADQIEDLVKDDLLFRDRQLKRLREEIVDLDDLDDTVSLTDFSLDEFRQDLLGFLREHASKLKDTPLGLYAVMAPPTDIPMAQSGVLFCLRQKTTDEPPASGHINPLAPHYLLYVQESGGVRLATTQAKATLNLFRQLASGQSEADTTLARLFDQKTKQGDCMDDYSSLLLQAVASVAAVFQDQVASGLQGNRNFVVPEESQQPLSGTEHFELVTWLVLLDPSA